MPRDLRNERESFDAMREALRTAPKLKAFSQPSKLKRKGSDFLIYLAITGLLTLSIAIVGFATLF